MLKTSFECDEKTSFECDENTEYCIGCFKGLILGIWLIVPSVVQCWSKNRGALEQWFFKVVQIPLAQETAKIHIGGQCLHEEGLQASILIIIVFLPFFPC